MTRINTNVSSLISQNTLARSNNDLQTALGRLSTGLRINKGKDDPAGLIASEALRSDITSIEKAITNSERANQLIATADSALGQVSQLLNDIRGLVSEAANTGALSDDQIAANQLQIDSSLEAIDRISQITSFQGKRLLDGSLDFNTKGVDFSSIEGLRIDQANFGSAASIGVDVNVVKQATRGQLNYNFGALAEDVVLQIGGGNGTEAFNFAKGSTIEEVAAAVNLVSDATGVEAVVESAATKGTIVASSFGTNNDVLLTANEAGFDAGDVRIKYTTGTSTSTTATYTAAVGDDPAAIEVALGVKAYEKASVTIDTAGADNDFKITAKQGGADFNDITINFTESGVAAGAEAITYDHSTKTLTIDKNAASTATQVVAAFTAAGNEEISRLFEAEVVETIGGGGGAVTITGAFATQTSGGVDGGEVIATANDVISAINNATGNDKVTASLAAGNDGYGKVSEFSNFAYSGVAEQNNALQFLSPGSAPNVRFVANAGSELGIDTSSDPRVEDFSSAVIQSSDANASFKISSKLKGTEYDGYTIKVVDSANVTAGTDEYVTVNRENKTIDIYIEDGVTTAQQLVDAVNADEYASQFFKAENFGSSDGSAAITIANLDDGVETSGGLVSEGTLVINLETDENGIVKTTANDLIAFFDAKAKTAADSPGTDSAADYLAARGISITNSGGSDGTGALKATTEDLSFATEGTELEDAQASGKTFAVNGENAQLSFTAINSGSKYDDVKIQFVNDGAVTGGTNERAEFDANNKTLTFYIEEGVTTAADIADIFDAAEGQYDADVAALFSVAAEGTGAGVVTSQDTATLTGGVVESGSVQGAALQGNSDLENTGLTFQATSFGSENFVNVKTLTGSFALTDENGNVSDRSTGTNVDVRINGIQAIGDGLKATINTSSLDLSFSLSVDASDNSKFSFEIVGGGALFQLGPDVVSNQQARLGIQSVSSATLGGVHGQLFELRSGGSKSLTADVGAAAKLVDEAINEVTQLRGRLGAFQKTTLESNIYTLNDTLANLTEAESSIRDADFAAESAKLTRAQILVQSGTSVLGIANQNPNSVLGLLR